jgi:glycosyltransferase involved in cell wall biosynthesis
VKIDYGLHVDWRRHCAAIIPCLNEAQTIAKLVSEVRTYVDTVLVIDDGSDDATGSLAEGTGAIVIRNERPCGKGAALVKAIRWLHHENFEWALTMDGDGQHLPSDIPHFFREAEGTSATMIVGNRMESAGPMPIIRKMTNRWMSKQLSRVAGRSLPDTQCGFRLIRVAIWLSVDIHSRHFEIESESLMAFLRAGEQIGFVPIQSVYGTERTKIRPALDSLRWFRWFWNARRLANPRVGRARTMLSQARNSQRI